MHGLRDLWGQASVLFYPTGLADRHPPDGFTLILEDDHDWEETCSVDHPIADGPNRGLRAIAYIQFP
jgi:hypothetical protein